jgi:hypothetical protein
MKVFGAGWQFLVLQKIRCGQLDLCIVQRLNGIIGEVHYTPMMILTTLLFRPYAAAV